MGLNDTKRSIADVFIHLLEKKSMDEITVMELAEASGISRQTFYYHFQDLTAVIEWLADNHTQIILEQALSKDDYESGLRYFLIEIETFYLPIKKLLLSDRRVEVEEILLEAINKLVDAIFQERNLDKKFTGQEYDFFIRFCASGIIGTLLHYLNTGSYNIDAIEEIIDNIMDIFNQVLMVE